MISKNSSRSMDAGSVILAAITVSAVGALFYNMLPVYLGTAQDSRGLDNAALGFLSTAFFFGYNVVTISAFYWIRRWNWRKVTLICLPLAGGGLLLGSLAQDYYLLLIFTAIAGGAFATLYGLGTTILSDSSNPARWFGLKIAAEAGVGALLLVILPGTLIAQYGFNGLVAGMLLAMLLLSPLLFLLPARGNKSHEQEEQEFQALDEMPESVNHWAIWCALFAALAFFSGSSAVWAFMERMGINAGFESQAVSNLLALTLAFATAGSLAAAVLGKKFGNSRPFILCLFAILVALVLLNHGDNFFGFAVACCVFTAGFGAGLPFAVAEIAELDVDGRYAVLSVPAIGLGAMIGPGVAGLAYADDSALLVLWLVAGAMVVAAALMAQAQRAQPKK